MNKIIYSKCSNERDEKFSLKTLIYEDEKGKRKVEKSPDTKLAVKHVMQIYQWYQQLEKQYVNTKIVMNRCKVAGNGVVLEYLEKPSMESILDKMILQNDKDNFVKMVQEYFKQLISVHQVEKFVMTDEFRNVFGEVAIPDEEVCGQFTNIDALFSNILILDDETWCMLDYEWTFDFPIPMKYLIYRIWFYYTHEHVTRNRACQWVHLRDYGINEDEIELYKKMEYNFQRYIQGTRIPIRDTFDEISPGIVHLDDMKYLGKEALRRQKIQIYKTNKNTVSEKDSYYQDIPESHYFEKEIQLPLDIRYFRMDPCSMPCLVKKLRITSENSQVRYNTNGIEIDDDILFFDTEDPWVLLNTPEQLSGEKISIAFEIEFIDEKTVSIIENFQRKKEENNILKEKEKNLSQMIRNNEIIIEERESIIEEQAKNIEQQARIIEQKKSESEQQKEKIHQLEILINQMENTKVWKLYSKYKAIGKKTGDK